MNEQKSFVENELIPLGKLGAYRNMNEANEWTVYISSIPLEKIKAAKSIFGIDIHIKIYYLCDTTLTHWFDDDEISLCVFTHDSLYLYSAFLSNTDGGNGAFFIKQWIDIDRVELIESEYVFYTDDELEYYSIPSRLICGHKGNEKKCLELLQKFANHFVNTEKNELKIINKQIEDIEKNIDELTDENNDYTIPEKVIELTNKILDLNPMSFNAYFKKSMALYQLKQFDKSLAIIDEYIKSLIRYYGKKNYDELKLEADEERKEIICLLGYIQFKNYIELNEYEKAIMSFCDSKYYWGDETDFPEDALKEFQDIYPTYISELISRDVNKRKILYATDVFFPTKTKTFLTIQADVNTDLIFPLGLPPKVDEFYIAHPYITNLYYHISDYEKMLFLDKEIEVNYLLQCLGAKKITINCIKGEDVQEYNKKAFNTEGEIGFVKSLKAKGGKESENIDNKKKQKSIHASQELNPQKSPYVPENLYWYKHDMVLRKLVEQRLEGNLLKYSINISTTDVDIVSSNEKKNFEAEFKFLIGKIGIKYSDEKLFSGKKDVNTEWQIDVEFVPKELLGNNSDISLGDKNLNRNEFTANEKEYADYYKECLNEGEINSQNKRILDRLKNKLSITDKRRDEIESLIRHNLEFNGYEKEYYDEIMFCIEDDGVISVEERKFLDKLKLKLNLTDDRAKIIENYAMNTNKRESK